MDTQSAFRALTAGTRFNKNRQAKQANPFQVHEGRQVVKGSMLIRESTTKTSKATTSKVTLDQQSDGDSDGDAATTAKNSKKRKRDGSNSAAADMPSSSALRKSLRIRCTGDDVPDLWSSFADFPGLPDEALESLALMSVLQPSPIQMQACSIICSRRDLLACAPTGSGKTLSFLLPLFLLSLSQATRPTAEKKQRPLGLVIEPTRELARQVYTEAGKLKRGSSWKVALLGEGESGQESETDAEGDAQASDLLITTPLKLVYAVKQGLVDISSVEYLVLDEADRLFELGFVNQTDEIIAACTNPALRKAMLSATIPSGVEELAKTVMSSDMIRVIIGGSDSATRTITQELVFAGTEDGKLLALKNLIKSGGLAPPALIFVQSVDRARDLNKELVAYNVKSDVMHAERTKEDRDKIVQRFAEAKIWVLVCTDVMSRGIDFRGVQLVINYDFPQSVQSYIHRIGRTGRAGRSGRAVTYFTKSDASYLRSIVNVMRNSGCDVPAWMLTLKAPSQKEKKKLRRKPVERKDVSRSVGSIGGGKGSRKDPKKAKMEKQGKSKNGKQGAANDSEEDSEDDGSD